MCRPAHASFTFAGRMRACSRRAHSQALKAPCRPRPRTVRVGCLRLQLEVHKDGCMVRRSLHFTFHRWIVLEERSVLSAPNALSEHAAGGDARLSAGDKSM